jgi:hypothetical protein
MRTPSSFGSAQPVLECIEHIVAAAHFLAVGL